MSKPMGMMSGCYFVGRAELLEWINNLLQLNYDKVEDTSNGAAFCQVIDAIHPGTVNLGRVNYNAVSEADMVENYKILQDSFDKNGITQYIDVPTLCKGKYMAALELFQWIHGYYEQVGGNPDYDAVARRHQTRCKEPNERGRINKKPAGMAKRSNGLPPNRNPKSQPPASRVKAGAIPGTAEAKATHNPPARVKKAGPAASVPSKAERNTKSESSAAESATVAKLKAKVAELQDEVTQMNQERDFYYEKLRKIEDFCQENEENEIVKTILDILYEADAERGFLPPDEEEEGYE